MKTFSVREVAQALNMTPRGVIQRLNRGQLKGNKKLNEFGVPEWHVYPNREILTAMEAAQSSPGGSSPLEVQSFAPDTDSIDAEDIEIAGDDPSDGPSSWREVEMERLEILAEKLVKPLAERIEFQAAELRDKERLIEEKERQLRLLPDLQKQAEQRAQERDLKHVENEALKKQVAALQLEQQQAEEAKKKIDELERTLSESRRKAEEEIERLKEGKEADAKAIEDLRVADEAKLAEKEAQAAAIQEQLQALSATVEELKKPKPSWWKKWFRLR